MLGRPRIELVCEKYKVSFNIMDNKDFSVEVWTDGGCWPNPGPGGWAFAFSPEECSHGTEKNTTNNIMELTAISKAIDHCKSTFPRGTKFTIYSDSQYCVKGFNTWMYKWKRNDWKRKDTVTKKKVPVKNVEIWKELYYKRSDIELVWVKGHDGDPMNELVDSLAGMYRE